MGLVELAVGWAREEIETHPMRFLFDLALLVFCVYILTRSSFRIPKKPEKLTTKEVEQLIAEWKPEPLVPPKEKRKKLKPFKVVSSAPQATLKIEHIDQPVMNFATFNFLGLAHDAEINAACKRTVEKYGVGSCGPRGFYGTIDIHLDLEKKLMEFLQVEDCVLYPYGFSTITSVIPAFANRNDMIVADEKVNFSVQEGIELARSKFVFFKHNDMDDLERILKEVKAADNGEPPKNRRFIVVQGMYENAGDVAPLKKIVEFKYKYGFRIIMDDSFGFGVLGDHGRGAAEFCGVKMSDIDLYTAGVEYALATVGGFCVGSKQVADFQRLSSLGYVFSASLPPYTCTASIEGLKRLQSSPNLLLKLRSNIEFMHSEIQKRLSDKIVMTGSIVSPVFCFYLAPSISSQLSIEQQAEILDQIEEKALHSGLAISVPQFSDREQNRSAPFIRAVVSRIHSQQDIEKACKILMDSFDSVLSSYK